LITNSTYLFGRPILQRNLRNTNQKSHTVNDVCLCLTFVSVSTEKSGLCAQHTPVFTSDSKSNQTATVRFFNSCQTVTKRLPNTAHVCTAELLHSLCALSTLTDSIWALVLVWRIVGKIIRTARSPAGWLPVHRDGDQLRVQRSVTNMGSLTLIW